MPKEAYMYGMADNANHHLETSPPPAYSELQPYVIPPRFWTFDMKDINDALSPIPKLESRVETTDFIFEHLKYDRELVPRDIVDCIRSSSRLAARYKAYRSKENKSKADWKFKANSFLCHASLKEFCEDLEPSCPVWSILFNGNGLEEAVETSHDGITTFSHIAATVARELTIESDAITITWFCTKLDHHSAERYRPQAMMASLVCQLLDKMMKEKIELNLSAEPIVRECERQQVENRDMDTLCRLFTRLMEKLPVGRKVFCILDGVITCENLDREGYLYMALDLLKHLSGAPAWKGGRVLKLMLTSQAEISQMVGLGIVEMLHYGLESPQWAERLKNARCHQFKEPDWIDDPYVCGHPQCRPIR